MRHLLFAALAAAATLTPALAAEHDESYQCGATMLFYWADGPELVYVVDNVNRNLLDVHVDANSFSGRDSVQPVTVKFDRKTKKMTVTTSGKPATVTCTVNQPDVGYKRR